MTEDIARANESPNLRTKHASSFLLSAGTTQAQNIDSIVVKGNAQVEADAIKTLLDSQEGMAIDRKKIRADIRKLHELGYFSDIRFKTDAGKGG